MQSHVPTMEVVIVELHIYVVYIDEVCVDGAGVFWNGHTNAKWNGTETRAVPVQVEPKYYGCVRVLPDGSYTLLVATNEELRRLCPQLRMGDAIVCTLLGYRWGLKAGAWVRAEDIQDAIDNAYNGVGPNTPVRVLRHEKRWSRNVRGWVDAPVTRSFEGTLAELCARYPLWRPAFEPIDSAHVRVRYSFLLLIPNGGWQSVEDPRSRMRHVDTTD